MIVSLQLKLYIPCLVSLSPLDQVIVSKISACLFSTPNTKGDKKETFNEHFIGLICRNTSTHPLVCMIYIELTMKSEPPTPTNRMALPFQTRMQWFGRATYNDLWEDVIMFLCSKLLTITGTSGTTFSCLLTKRADEFNCL